MGGGSGSTPIPPVEKKLIHMVDFIEAVDTINDPESNYLILHEDNDDYIFDVEQQTTPIEAGSFYKYYDGMSGVPDIVIDDYAIGLNEYEPEVDPIGFAAFTKFPKSQFDLGSNYSNVTYSNLPLQDPIAVTTAHRNNMTYNSSDLPGGLYTTVKVSNSQLQMTSSNYSSLNECYYIADRRINASTPFTVYLPTGESFLITYTTWFFKVTQFTESDQ